MAGAVLQEGGTLARATLDGGIAALVSRGMESLGFLVAFTERGGGVSEGRYGSLNLGFGSGDVPSLVRENRRRICEQLELPSFACVYQVHSARVIRVGEGRVARGFRGPDRTVPRADAMVTSRPRTGIAVLAADCVPVALADPATGTVAVVHAGWRGIAAGLLDATLRAFPDPRSVHASVGPAIGPDHYEVGDEVAAAVLAGTRGAAVLARPGGGARPRLDLPASVARVLSQAGVRSIEVAGLCTACHEDRWFSHRRDGRGGRQALIASVLR